MSAVEGGVGFAVTLEFIREQRARISRACAELAQSLRRGAFAEGLEAVERICATALMTDTLMSFLSATEAPRDVLEEAGRVRARMLGESSRWLAVAVRDLPGAEELARRFLSTPQATQHRGREDAHE
jgi:hypothetical protein